MLGVDVAQKVDYTAIAAVAPSMRPRNPFASYSNDPAERERYEIMQQMVERGELRMPIPGNEAHFDVRMLSRLPRNTPYPEQARAIAHVCRSVLAQTGGVYPRLFLDATGVGSAFLDMLRVEEPPAIIVPVYFTHGDRMVWRREGPPPAMVYGNRHGRADRRPWVVSLGKAWLVTRLQGLFESRRIHISASNDEADAMQKELAAYKIKKTDVDNEKYGAFDTGEHDDMVTALGLATIEDNTGSPSGEQAKHEAIVPVVL